MKQVVLLLAASLVSGCGGPPPLAPDTRLIEPPAWAMRPPAGPSPIPERDGDPKVRRAYLAGERINHASCVDRHAVLRRIILAERKPQ